MSRETDRADRSLFVQELLLALMSDSTDAIRTGISEHELCSSVEDLLLSSDGLLSESASSPATSSQHGSTSSIAGVCDGTTDSALVTNSSRVVENCDPIGKESFNVAVGNCGAAGGLEVACTRAAML